ncbi:hypothetical protein ACFVVX_03015 [Kitasatospora sp. NPDC058170]|uniref:hypothetical protein n=1 Tax=Kitasatospora sp. NPDC058170 TaxID=3346364 RepID=UPI0036D8E1F6
MTETTDMGELLSVDIDSLSIDEIDIIEEVIDAPLDSLAKSGARRGPMLRAMAVVIKRRTDPDFSIEDAGRIQISIKSAKKVDPTALSE